MMTMVMTMVMRLLSVVRFDTHVSMLMSSVLLLLILLRLRLKLGRPMANTSACASRRASK